MTELARRVLNKETINEELERNLPVYLENDLINLKEGLKNDVSYLDCLINELQGSVNSAFVDGVIIEEQCDYFFKNILEWRNYNVYTERKRKKQTI